MQSEPINRGEMSQDSRTPPLHPEVMSPTRFAAKRPLDPASHRGRRAFDALSASSVGLELGLSVVIGVLFGHWLDGQLGTTPWMLLLFLCFGFAAGMRGVIRSVARADRAAAALEGTDG